MSRRLEDVRRMVRQLGGPGWIIERGTKHWRARLPGRCDFVTVNTNTGEWHSLMNLRANIRRYQRQQGPQR